MIKTSISSIDHEIERVTVGQMKFNGRGLYKGKKNELLGLIHTTDWLKDPEALARNGKTFLNKLAPEVASSKATLERLTKYATVSLEWYVESMSDLVEVGGNVASLVRTQEGWQKIRPRILSKWKVFRVAKNVMEDALPKL